jgi:hypothetical protein
MIGDHHGRTARRANLLVRAMDDILGTHSLASGPAAPAPAGPDPAAARPG